MYSMQRAIFYVVQYMNLIDNFEKQKVGNCNFGINRTWHENPYSALYCQITKSWMYIAGLMPYIDYGTTFLEFYSEK
jgi:hypothetical protein